MSATIKEPEHWSKDFVEHLRAVHFALVTLALTLIVIGLPPEELTSEAVTEATAIQNLRLNWEGVQKDLLAAAIYQTANYGGSVNQAIPLIVTANPGVPSITGKTQLLLQYNAIEQPTLADTDRGLVVGIPLYPHTAPETLGEFEKYWNQLHLGQVYMFPDARKRWTPIRCVAWMNLPEEQEAAAEDSLTNPTCSESKSPDIDGAKTVKAKLKYLWPNPEAAPVISFAGAIDQVNGFSNGGKPFPARVYVQLNTPLRSITLHDDSLSRYVGGRKGDFKSAFWGLSGIQLRQPFMEFVPIKDSVDKLSTLASKAEQQVEIIGLKIPLTGLTTWGTLVILLVQVYFWVHLHELNHRKERALSGFDVAWIGLYPSKVSIGAVFTSACLMPCAAVAVLAYRFLKSPEVSSNWRHWQIFAVVLVLLVQLVLSISIFIGVAGIRRLSNLDARLK